MNEVIDISAAIKKREEEIELLKSLRPLIEELKQDAINAESNRDCMPAIQFNKLSEKVERLMWELGLIRQVPSTLGYGIAIVGKPDQWSMVEIK